MKIKPLPIKIKPIDLITEKMQKLQEKLITHLQKILLKNQIIEIITTINLLFNNKYKMFFQITEVDKD